MSNHQDSDTKPLAGQVAWVTGGGRGIGRAIAEALAAAGASVAVMARSAEQVAESVTALETARGTGNNPVRGFVADVTDGARMEAVAQEIAATLGAVDLLVNNAAIAGPAGPSWEVDPDEWWRCEEINVRGPFLCARAVLPSMVARCRGRIVNVASLGGIYPMAYASGYATSKAALIRWSEILASETAEHQIGVFSIHPGDVMTEMALELMSEENARWLPWAREHFTQKSVPLTHAAELVLWLAMGLGDALSGCFLSVYDDMEQIAARAATIQEKNLLTLRLRV